MLIKVALRLGLSRFPKAEVIDRATLATDASHDSVGRALRHLVEGSQARASAAAAIGRLPAEKRNPPRRSPIRSSAGSVSRSASTAIDSTYIKNQRAAFGVKRGRLAQAIGRSQGGWTTKLHAFTDVVGRPSALIPTPGGVSDIKVAPDLLERAGSMRYLLGDKGDDADNCALCSVQQATAVIPRHRNRQRAICYDKQPYRSRHLIENAFCRLKYFRCVAIPYYNLAANFLSAVALRTAVAFWLWMSLSPRKGRHTNDDAGLSRIIRRPICYDPDA